MRARRPTRNAHAEGSHGAAPRSRDSVRLRLTARFASRRFEPAGGAARIRTGDQGFADPCLTTWLRRRGRPRRRRRAAFSGRGEVWVTRGVAPVNRGRPEPARRAVVTPLAGPWDAARASLSRPPPFAPPRAALPP